MPLVAWSLARLARPVSDLAGGIALAFAVSWMADWLPHGGANPLLVSALYVVTQAGLVGLLLLPLRQALAFLAVLGLAALASLLLTRAARPDWVVHSVAWLGIVVMARSRRDLGLVRWSVLVTFGLGWLTWVWYVLAPGWPSWGALQGCRALGAGLFVAALLRLVPARPIVDPA